MRIYIILLTMFLILGCAKKIEYVYIKQSIPEELLKKESIIFRDVKSHNDTAELIIDLYRALNKCNIKLEKINDLVLF